MGKLWMGETSHPHVMVQHSTSSGPPVTAPLPASWTQHQLTGSTVDPFKLSLTFFHPLIIRHSCCLLLPVSAPALPPAPVFFLATLPAPGPFPAGRKGRFCLLAAALPLNQVDVGVDEARSRPWVVGRLLLVYVAGHPQCNAAAHCTWPAWALGQQGRRKQPGRRGEGDPCTLPHHLTGHIIPPPNPTYLCIPLPYLVRGACVHTSTPPVKGEGHCSCTRE